jgi:hypothetical protein
MLSALENIRKYRAIGELDKLIKIAEHELGERFRIYSPKLIPLKNDFIADICNYIALGHIDKLTKLSTKITTASYDDYGILMKIFELPLRPIAIPYLFGDQNTYRDPAEPDMSFLVFKNNINRLERRLEQQPMLRIERCHLYHEMGRENLKQQRIDEARTYGRRIVTEAQGVSYFWIFLGYVMICRADVLQKLFKKAHETLTDAFQMIDIFKSDELKCVIATALEVSHSILYIQLGMSIFLSLSISHFHSLMS